VDVLTTLDVVAYAAAAALYLAFHVGLGTRAAKLGRLVLVAGFGVQVVGITIGCLRGAHPASSTSEAVAFIAWMIAGGFLAASFRYRLDAAGAFALPAAVVLLLLARVAPTDTVAVATGGAPDRSLGTTHIFLATLGVATFALAAVLALVYLMQERRLKRRDFHLGEATTPLHTLDRLAARCVSFGFPIFTLAILTGALWVARLGLLRSGSAIRAEYVLAVACWVAFGVLLIARVGAGWQGRRAAWLTLGGFSGAILVVLAYFIRHAT
jgi:ABC-type uncharacterized transport system permease subunit